MIAVPHILIVEDSPDDVELLLRDLRRNGLESTYRRVQTAEEVVEALQQERFDIVLSDFNLPGVDFRDILNAVLEHDPDLPFIVVSGSIGEENAVALMHEGVADFILKGNTARLIPAIQRELAAAEQQLARRESDQRFRDIVEVSGDWIWETDAEHRYTFLSTNKFADAEWADPQAWLGKTCCELAGANPLADEHWQNHLNELDAHNAFRSFLVSFQPTPESRYHVSFSGLPVFDRDGLFRGYRGTAKDETPMIEAFWRAEEAQALLRDAVESISEGFVIFDPKDRIVMVNEAYRRLFPELVDLLVPGTSYEDLLRAGVQRQVYPDALGRESEWLERALADHYELSGNTVLQLDNGRWALVTERRMSNGGAAGLTMDITTLKTLEAQRDHFANHDLLTGLPNQALFAGLLRQSLNHLRHAKGALAVVCLELVSLRSIRDGHGIEIGDTAIRETGRRLISSVKMSDTVAHIGGGQFLALLTEMADEDEAVEALDELLGQFDEDLKIGQREIPLRVAAGVSTAPGDTTEPDAIMRYASTAMNRSKEVPTRRFHFYSSEMTNVAIQRASMESELRHAARNGELCLVYQPLVSTHTFDLVGAEALARWQHPRLGLVSPGEFIPIAEQTGLIIPVGEHLLRMACQQARIWEQQGRRPQPISVNVSAVQLADPDIGKKVRTILEETEVTPTNIKLELTESAILRDIDTATRTMRELASLGLSFALDDFGMEYSALSYLSELPIDTLKIDRSFLLKMTQDRGHAALYQAIVAMAHSLGMTAVAEGVESADEITYLQAYGCDMLQGFLFSQPIPPEDFASLLEAARVYPHAESSGSSSSGDDDEDLRTTSAA